MQVPPHWKIGKMYLPVKLLPQLTKIFRILS
jgi:hypothetical protein